MSGIMKGVILGSIPGNAGGITTAFPTPAVGSELSSWRRRRRFPQGTVDLAVVDPGVGGVRRPIVVETDKRSSVGPDNGIFTDTAGLSGFPGLSAYDSDYFLEPVSRTFHGRDIFAPAAAHLSRGTSLAVLGV